MRRFLLALTLLTTIALLQSAVAIAPVQASEEAGSVANLSGQASGEKSFPSGDRARVQLLGSSPAQPMSLGLLLVGLSGLAAAGDRTTRELRDDRG